MFKNYFIFRVMKTLGIPDEGIKYVEALYKASHDMAHGIPKELVDLNVMNFIRGVFTRVIISSNLDWVLPYWMYKQYDASSISFVARGFQASSINVAHRNWTAIGSLESEYEATVDEKGLIGPYYNSWTLDFWLGMSKKLYAPSKIDSVVQRLADNLPIVVTEFTAEDIRVEAHAFGDKIDGKDVVFEKVIVKNLGSIKKKFSLYYSVRPYNVEGMKLINAIEYNSNENTISVDEDLAVKFISKPDLVYCSNFEKGDVSLFLDTDYAIANESKCEVGLCTAAVEYIIELEPGEQKEYEARLPIVKTSKYSSIFDSDVAYIGTLEKLIERWNEKLAETMQISIPDKRVKDAFDANKAYMLLFYDGKSINPGPSSYHSFWLRDAAYLVNGLDKIGFTQEAKNVLATYPDRLRKDGFFFSQEGEWDSNGEAIWVLIEHYRMTKDVEFLKYLYPSIKKGADWIINKVKETERPSIPESLRGLLPPGLSAEHFGAHDYYYWDDFWALAGLRDAAFAAKELGDHDSHSKFSQAFDRLMNIVNVSLKEVAARLGQPLMPISPNRRMDSAAVGCLSAVYPLRVMSQYDERVTNTLKYMEATTFQGNGFFHDVNHSGYGTYLTTHFIEAHIYLRSQRAIEILDWLVDVATDTYTWPESINPTTMGGCIGDGHHGWAAADYLVTIRNIFFFEEDNRLVLMPVVPRRWFKPNNPISVSNAPSYFGRINYTAFVDKNKLKIVIENQYTVVPEDIEINLPFKIKNVQVDRIDAAFENSRIIIDPNAREIIVDIEE
ncbi:MAG: hypothetical protein DKM50_01520 [Candidatus Margulisiibacteriota bacterium]|nr:MAG: hypothetical protein A2X43_08290 [Candidatus Margulisbacteria bacterium GWD2_39_127]OGI11672.1 MAG: hypothetical protein A2X41_10310 [Candidatus Margulisbacteria bacterium GWE2_39_32]PZM83782.1 MAG: hypothetical protein DKM50_01520 [Candidatus Margulisiibacteriota bacterium]HAR63026.1 hypothetical protein [Candidatus Margulisiibacteriota bacterium]HCT86261.1 hypothetical protein [Candidatus Margulisiibacteriota bacterium]